MAFTLQSVVPWGRKLEEYAAFFNLSDNDLQKNIVSFGDGPASFNAEMTALGNSVTSLDIIYRFNKKEIAQRINETTNIILQQANENKDSFVWKQIKNVNDLAITRTEAMNMFLKDYDKGLNESRYIYHELPLKTQFSDKEFDIGLSSHFLLLYSQLGENFHLQSIQEMLRVCKEVRIFPIIDLQNIQGEIFESVFSFFSKRYKVEIVHVNYEFQKGGNQMLKIYHT